MRLMNTTQEGTRPLQMRPSLQKEQAIAQGRKAMESVITFIDNNVVSLASLPNYQEILQKSVELDLLIVQAYS